MEIRLLPRRKFEKADPEQIVSAPIGKPIALVIAVMLVFFVNVSSSADRNDRAERSGRLDLAEDQHWNLAGPSSVIFSTKAHDDSLVDEQSSFHVELKQALKANERVILWHPLLSSLTEGTTLKIRLRGQADHQTTIRFGISTSIQGESIIKDIDPVSFGSQGRDDYRSFDMPQAKPGQYFFWFDLGKTPVKIDLSHVHLYVSHVRITEEQARLKVRVAPAAVARRIDSYRKGELTVSVIDKSGHVVANAPVKIEQVRHEFPFGGSARYLKLNAKDPISRVSEKSYLELFNAVAVPFYWKEYQSEQSATAGALQDSILQWSKKNQLIPFAQGLVTEEDYPAWQPQTPTLIGPAIRGHILTVLKKYGDKIPTWSIYAGLSNSIAGDAKSPFAAWVNSVNGAPGAVQRTLEWASAASSGAHNLLEISEGNEPLLDKTPLSDNHQAMHRPQRRPGHFYHEDGGEHEFGTATSWNEKWKHYESRRPGASRNWKRDSALADQEWEETQRSKEKFNSLVQTLQSNGVQLSLLGLRFNMRQTPIEADEIWRNCALLSQSQFPVQIDELAVLSGDPQNGYPAPASWPSTTSGEEEQAKRIVEAYGVLFSNRFVRGIYYLNICDRESLNHAPYGLLRSDGTQKPAYKALQNLLHHTWWTQTTGKTNEKGTFSTRAFYGDYNIIVEAKGKTTKLPFKLSSTASPATQTIRVTLPE